jgi:hypothetical protein
MKQDPQIAKERQPAEKNGYLKRSNEDSVINSANSSSLSSSNGRKKYLINNVSLIVENGDITPDLAFELSQKIKVI